MDIENVVLHNTNEKTDVIGDVEAFDTSTSVTPGVYYPKNRYRRQVSSRPMTRKVVHKNGDFNIDKTNPNNRFSYFSSWFMTMVEARWRWTLINFFAAYTADWLLFGFIHWIIALSHGDLTDDHLPHNQNISKWTPCVRNIYGFTSTFLFSVEVHTTVAYGKRAITLECPQTIVTMCLQCILSSIFSAFMVGILFAKLTRPKSRTLTILFSQQAVISLRNDKLCFIFRVGDVRTSKILNVKVSVFVLRLEIYNEYLEDFEQIELKTEMDGCDSTFFLWPVSVIHVIEKGSPLYDISAADLLCGKIEVLAVFEGLIESTGQPVQARTSYTVKDILWGHRFVQMVENDVNKYRYDVDFAKLSQTVRVDTPLCSGHEYENMVNVLESIENNVKSREPQDLQVNNKSSCGNRNVKDSNENLDNRHPSYELRQLVLTI